MEYELSTSEFDEKCIGLEQRILKVYHFFMWYGSMIKNRSDELRSIIFLDGLFLQMLKDIKDIYTKRDQKLYNEFTGLFKDLLVLMNDKMHNGTCYIRCSSICLETELASEDSCTALMRRDVVEGFRELSEWMKEVTQDSKNREKAKKMIDELGLNYQKRMFGCIGDNFEQHTNMVLNGLILLAIPSHTDATDEEFAELFKNSYKAFHQSSYCKEELEVQASEVDDEYSEYDSLTPERRVAHLKKLWGAKKAEIRSFLGQLGISYTNTISDVCMGRMGRKLYETLNTDIGEHDRKMSNDELCHYFMKEAQLEYLASEIIRARTVKDDPTPGKEFFAETVKRSDLRQALYKTIYEEQGVSKNGEKRYVLGAMGHWLAILKVMQTYDMVRGSMKDFADLMNVWYPIAPYPCDYRSMISVRAFEVKANPYPKWSKLDKANYPYLRVADTFLKYLHEYNLVD